MTKAQKKSGIDYLLGAIHIAEQEMNKEKFKWGIESVHNAYGANAALFFTGVISEEQYDTNLGKLVELECELKYRAKKQGLEI